MNSLLYKHLYDKANNDYSKDKIVYYDKTPYTFEKFHKLVLIFKIFFEQNPIRYDIYLLVKNDVYSIAMVVALLELGYSPVLVDYYAYHKDFKSKENDNESLYFKKGIIGFFDEKRLDKEKLDEDIKKMKERTIINKRAPQQLGILTSGSIDTPKLVYLDEKEIIDNVKSSYFYNTERRIYNPINISSISGLFTNVFTPIVSTNSSAQLTNKYNMHFMLKCTDIFLKRDIQTIFRDTPRIEVGDIKRFFVFGETSNKDTIDFLHNIDVLDFQVINVYGSTELGGLAYECEEKDMEEIYIYRYDIDNDSLIYSFDNIHFFKREKDKETELTEEETNSIKGKDYIRFLPCGIKDNRITLNSYNLGEAIINGHNTGDIFLIINNKLYALGRKDDLIMNTSLAYLDNLFTTKIKRKCTVFEHDGELYLAVRYPLEYNETRLGNDHTIYFRRFIGQTKKIREIVKENSSLIKDILFLTDRDFPISKSLQKSQRNKFAEQLKYYQTINYRLENFDKELIKNIEEAFTKNLHYTPEYFLTNDRCIAIPYDQITEPDLVELINDLNIVAIERHDDEELYALYYDDGYFFDINRNYLYSEERMKEYRILAKDGLFIPKLLNDNRNRYLKDIFSPTFKRDSSFYVPLKVVAKVHENENHDIIMIPYYQNGALFSEIVAYDRREVQELINEKYPGIVFKDKFFDAYSNNNDDSFFWRDYVKKPIIIKANGEIESDQRGRQLALAYLHQDTLRKINGMQIEEFVKKLGGKL